MVLLIPFSRLRPLVSKLILAEKNTDRGVADRTMWTLDKATWQRILDLRENLGWEKEVHNIDIGLLKFKTRKPTPCCNKR